MMLHLNLSAVADYRRFLQVKSLPRYRVVGHTVEFPDEYAGLLGLTQNEMPPLAYGPMPFLFDYQAAIATLAIRKQKFAVFAQCGLGKSLILLEFARHVANILGDDRNIERSIRLYTNPGEVVFDPFMGIGSTGFMALGSSSPKTGRRIADPRRFYGCEIKPEYLVAARANLTRAENMQKEENRTLFDAL